MTEICTEGESTYFQLHLPFDTNKFVAMADSITNTLQVKLIESDDHRTTHATQCFRFYHGMPEKWNYKVKGSKCHFSMSHGDETSFWLYDLNTRQLRSVQMGTLEAAQDVTLIRKRVESCDFTIVCCGVKIPVHTVVLRTYWEYFDVLMRNDCVERTNKTLQLEYPLEWVQNLVSYLYGEKLRVPIDILTALMMLGSLYQLPDLVKATEKEILQFAHSAVCFEDLIIGWQRAVQTGNDTVKNHMLSCVVEMCRSAKPTQGVLKEWLEPLTKDEATDFVAEFMSRY